jgi:hypothetical protein
VYDYDRRFEPDHSFFVLAAPFFLPVLPDPLQLIEPVLPSRVLLSLGEREGNIPDSD